MGSRTHHAQEFSVAGKEQQTKTAANVVRGGQVSSQLAAELGRVVHPVLVACFGVMKDTQVAVELSSMVKERRAPESRHVAEDSSHPL